MLVIEFVFENLLHLSQDKSSKHRKNVNLKRSLVCEFNKIFIKIMSLFSNNNMRE